MGGKGFLGEFEQLVLLAVLRQEPRAYAVSVRQEIERRAGLRVSRGAVYVTLDRLERKGLLRSELGDATPQRGGRPKRFYRLRAAGTVALRQTRRALGRMWDGLEMEIGGA